MNINKLKTFFSSTLLSTSLFASFASPIFAGMFIFAVYQPASAGGVYDTRLTSGPFMVLNNAASVDWVVINNDSNPVDIRVTIYQLNTLDTKVAFGPVSTFTVDPDETYRNANYMPPGRYYELVIESNSENILPAVNQWSCNLGSCSIPGTLIPSGVFIVSKAK